MSEDIGEPKPSPRSARESVRWLLKSGRAYLDKDGLAIPRHNRTDSDALTVDEVLDRLSVLGVPESSVAISIRSKAPRFEVRVSGEGLRLLAHMYPKLLQPGLDQLADAGESPI